MRLIALLEGSASFIDPQIPTEEILDDLEELLGNTTESVINALLEGLEDRIKFVSDKLDVPEDTVASWAKADPTQGSYLQWIGKLVQKGDLAFPEDESKVRETLSSFEKLKKTPAFTGNKDIGSYKEFSALYDAVSDASGITSKREKVRISQEKGIELIAGDSKNGVFKVTTPEAGAKAFRDTAWCVKDPEYFKRYNPPVYYMVVQDGKRFALYHEQTMQFKGTNDAQLSLKKAAPVADLMKKAGLLPDLEDAAAGLVAGGINKTICGLAVLASGNNSFVDRLVKKLGSTTSKKQRQGSLWSLKAINEMGEEAWKEAVTVRLADYDPPKALIDLANKHKAAMEIILRYPYAALAYYDAHKAPNRWPEGEPILARHAYIAFAYAKATGERFLAAEETILNSNHPFEYARDVIKGRWPEFEDKIEREVQANSVWLAIDYARSILKGRWPELEAVMIEKYPEAARLYSLRVIGGRWPEFEEAILNRKVDPVNSALYAKYVIEGRWPEYEKVILDNKDERRFLQYHMHAPRTPGFSKFEGEAKKLGMRNPQ